MKFTDETEVDFKMTTHPHRAYTNIIVQAYKHHIQRQNKQVMA